MGTDAEPADPVEDVGVWRMTLPGGVPLNVQVVIDHGSPDAIADFLASVDPVELEDTALNRLDCDTDAPGGGTAAMLRELAERARR